MNDHDETFCLANDPPPPKKQLFHSVRGKQLRFLSGDAENLDGQQDLFDHDGLPESSAKK